MDIEEKLRKRKDFLEYQKLQRKLSEVADEIKALCIQKGLCVEDADQALIYAKKKIRESKVN